MQKGGININNKSKDDAFIHFISNSSIKIVSVGSFGITLVAKLNKNAKSDYTHINIGHFGEKVDTLLMKLCFINRNQEIIPAIGLPQNIVVTSINKTEFIHELETQNRVYMQSIDYLMPFCPSIVFSNIIEENENPISFLETFKDILKNNDKTFFINIIEQYIQNKEISGLGIIGMEFMDGYEVVDKYIKKKDYHVIACCVYIIIKTAVQTMISHADFHTSNLMINLNDHTFFGDKLFEGKKLGRPILIDFGQGIKLDSSTHLQIKDLFKQKKYQEILTILCNYGRYDGLDFQQEETLYGWICHANHPKILKILNKLDDAHKMMRIVVFSVYGELHKYYPNKLPSLPLSESDFKINFFNPEISLNNENSIPENSIPLLPVSEHVLTPYAYMPANATPISTFAGGNARYFSIHRKGGSGSHRTSRNRGAMPMLKRIKTAKKRNP